MLSNKEVTISAEDIDQNNFSDFNNATKITINDVGCMTSQLGALFDFIAASNTVERLNIVGIIEPEVTAALAGKLGANSNLKKLDLSKAYEAFVVVECEAEMLEAILSGTSLRTIVLDQANFTAPEMGSLNTFAQKCGKRVTVAKSL